MAFELRRASDEPAKLPDPMSLQRSIQRWESGRIKKISERYRLLYSAVFGIPEDELFPPPPPRRIPASIDDHEDMERRKLLGSLAALGAVSSPAFDALAHIQSSVERALGTDTAAHLDAWEEALSEYGYTYPVKTAAELIPELASGIVTVRTIMGREKTDTPLHRSWCRVVAGLSLLLAKALSGQQRPQEARTWWTTAQQAADTSGDVNLSLWVSGEQLIHGLYERRPAPLLLRRANDIADRAGDAPHRGLATVLSARAQLLAIEGRADDATEALRKTADLYTRFPKSVTHDPRSLAGWGEERVLYTETFVRAHLGDADGADASAVHAIDLTPNTSSRFRAQLELLRGFGRVRAGDTTEGVRHAYRVIEADPVGSGSLMATSIAGDILFAVPDTERSGPLITGYRELLAASSPQAVT